VQTTAKASFWTRGSHGTFIFVFKIPYGLEKRGPLWEGL